MSSDVTRSNYSANSILTSAALNADFNQILARINDFPGDQITDATITSGKFLAVTQTKTTTHTALTTDDILLCDTSGGAWTLSLPTAVGLKGKIFTIVKTSTDSNALTIDPNSTETLSGATTYKIYGQNEVARIISDDSNWIALNPLRVYVYGQSNSNDALTADTTNIPFTEVVDTHGAFDGAIFTAPYDKDYIFSIGVRCNSSATRLLKMYVDGSLSRYIDAGKESLSNGKNNSNGIVYLKKNQTLSFRSDTNSTLSNSVPEQHYLIIRGL